MDRQQHMYRITCTGQRLTVFYRDGGSGLADRYVVFECPGTAGVYVKREKYKSQYT